MVNKAVCIISGGMDSTLCGYIAKYEDQKDIIALHFNYGQRTQDRELKAFQEIAKSLNAIKSYSIDLDFFTAIGGSALTDTRIDVPKEGISDDIPITYVPFRNGIFLSIATAIAEKEGANSIYIGVVEEDSSGYPDCRERFIDAFEKAANLGTKPSTNLQIVTPLIELKKEDIVQKALALNVPLELTWSCYEREDVACGKCDSCRLRLKGFEKAGVKDQIPYL